MNSTPKLKNSIKIQGYIMKKEGFTIGDEIKKNHSFTLNPYSKGIYVRQKPIIYQLFS